MPDFLDELFERPSRLIGWGVVAVVHFIAWQVLVHGLNWVKVMPALEAVQVIMVNDNPPPMPPPSVPKVEQPVRAELFVPVPEVKVVQEAAVLVSTSTITPPMVTTQIESPAASTQAYSINPVVVDESEVDYLVRPEVRYPQASRRAREHGMVLLSVIVNNRGLVEYVNVYKSSGYRRLDESASHAVRNMRVKPYMRNGIAMAVEIRIPVEFS